MEPKELSIEVLRQPITNGEIIPITMTYNLNNPNVLLVIKQSFDNFQYSKTMSSIFQRKKLVRSIKQAPDHGRLLCRSKLK